MATCIRNGNLFDSNASYIFHQVNCRGKMGSGVAKQVRERYPVAYMSYRSKCQSSAPAELIGHSQLVNCGNRYIVNLFAQSSYGYDGKQYTDYDAFRSCLREAANNIPSGTVIAMPYLIGCGLGGGDWNTVYEIIKEELSDFNVELWRYVNAC